MTKIDKQPLVSVLINNYNYSRFLRYCIQSALDQSYQNIEIIFYDDGSKDDSVEVAKSFGEKVLVLAEENFGTHHLSFNQSNAVYQAFLRSTGEIICLLDSDDAFMKDKVLKVVEAFNSDPEAVLVQHFFNEIDDGNNFTGNIRPKEMKKVDPRKYIFKTNNLLGLFAQTSALSFRRSYLEKVLPVEIDDYDKINLDVRLSRQSALHGATVTLREPLSEYRIHGTNWINNLKDNSFYLDLLHQMYDFFNEKAELNQSEKIDLYKSVNRPDKKNIGLLYYYLFSKEPIGVKYRFLYESIFRKKILRKSIRNAIAKIINGRKKVFINEVLKSNGLDYSGPYIQFDKSWFIKFKSDKKELKRYRIETIIQSQESNAAYSMTENSPPMPMMAFPLVIYQSSNDYLSIVVKDMKFKDLVNFSLSIQKDKWYKISVDINNEKDQFKLLVNDELAVRGKTKNLYPEQEMTIGKGFMNRRWTGKMAYLKFYNPDNDEVFNYIDAGNLPDELIVRN